MNISDIKHFKSLPVPVPVPLPVPVLTHRNEIITTTKMLIRYVQTGSKKRGEDGNGWKRMEMGRALVGR